MQFLQTFASDRSHMKVDDGSTYVKPPPPFPLIFVEGIVELQMDQYMVKSKPT